VLLYSTWGIKGVGEKMMKIMHITDLHFGYHRQDIIEPFLNDVARLKPDYVIVSGDLTHRGKNEQYLELMDFLQRIRAQVIIVPGNHDVPWNNLIARAFYPYWRYKRYVAELFPQQIETSELTIYGINTVNPLYIKDGIMRRSALNRLSRFMRKNSDKRNLVFLHHNFDYIAGLHKPLRHYQKFVRYLKNSPIHMVFTGHLHYANITILEKNDHKPCLLLHGGSLLCQRSKDKKNSYYFIELDGSQCAIQWRVFGENQFTTQQHFDTDFSQNSKGQQVNFVA